MRVALFTNIPAPYRVPVYDRLARALDSFKVFYLAPNEANRGWRVPELAHDHEFLRGRTIRVSDRFVHTNRGVVSALRRFAPNVVITGGLNPAMLAAWAYTQATRARHIALADTWLGAEPQLSMAHRVLRRTVYGRSQAFIGASEKTLDFFRHYGARENLFKAPLGVDNDAFMRAAGNRRYDLVFAGNLVERKQPVFFARVASGVSARRGKLNVLVIGDGELHAEMERAFRVNGDVKFTGFLQQDELPAAYAQGKVFCFPTLADPWGVVANEACAAGLPVVTSPNAGVADELVVADSNGYVLPLEEEVWADRISALLDDSSLLAQMSAASRERVKDYSFDAAADGFLAAIEASHG